MPAQEKVEALKTQMISDVEGPFRSRLEDLQRENESLRTDNAKLKHDFAFLKTEYEHTLQRHKSTLDDLRLQHEAEVRGRRLVTELGLRRGRKASRSNNDCFPSQ